MFARDTTGNLDTSPAMRTFTVIAPQTKITGGPARRVRSGSVTLRFSSTQRGGSFRCRLDRGRTLRCRSSLTYRHLRRGRHTLTVYAVNRYGLRDASPEKRSWTRR